MKISCHKPDVEFLMLVYKGKGDPLNTSFSQGIKLLEHAFSVIRSVMKKAQRNHRHWQNAV